MSTQASDPTPIRVPPSASQTSRSPQRVLPQRSSARSDPSTRGATNYSSTGSSYKLGSSATTGSDLNRTSLSSLRESLPKKPHIYDFSEISSATNNFLSKTNSHSASWRCTLRGKDVVVFQRKLRRPLDLQTLRDRLSVLYRSHHMSIIKLLGVSLSPSSDYVYLAYDFVPGASLADCLRNPRNPNFTVLSNWMSRIQVAADLADGLDYVHNNTGLERCHVHKHIKSSAIIVTEPGFNAKICHFGAAELCGETDMEGKEKGRRNSGEIEGVRGYMAPELGMCGIATQKSDIYAFGVVILELLSGKEPVRYKFNRESGDYRKISVIEEAEYAVDGEREVVAARLRKWMDMRLRDSFPVEAVQKLVRLALECVHIEANKRPDMTRVTHKISKLYLQSKVWCERVKVPTEISVSLAPR